jgi:hypothetical protein
MRFFMGFREVIDKSMESAHDDEDLEYHLPDTPIEPYRYPACWKLYFHLSPVPDVQVGTKAA